MSHFADRRNKQQLESARAIEQERADKRIQAKVPPARDERPGYTPREG